jgi:glycosyltransferase involved in cell wall biosynthesis
MKKFYKMKIVHIISSLNTGGAETMLVRLIRGMPNHNHVVITLTAVGPLGELLQASGYAVHNIGLRASNAWYALPQLWKIIYGESPDIVQTWMYHADLIGGVIGRMAGVRNIVWNVRNTEIPQGQLSMTGLIIRLCAVISGWLPKAVICCAHAGLEVHAARGYKRQKMLVLPNGYDTHEWQPKCVDRWEIRRDYGLSREAFVVGIVGRYDKLKGYDLFIEAANRISKVIHNVLFIMVGRNVDDTNVELRSLIESRGGDAAFRLFGERSDVAQLMSTMDVFCLTSSAEGFPNVVAEAMLMRVPCVVTNVGDAARIVGSRGLVVPSGNPNAFAEAVKSVESNGVEWRKAAGEAARQHIVDHYSIEIISKNYEQLYENICEEMRR